jgi:hypothetical protein
MELSRKNNPDWGKTTRLKLSTVPDVQFFSQNEAYLESVKILRAVMFFFTNVAASKQSVDKL